MADKVFTKKELSDYNGKNGKSSYVAVNGIVYDVSNVQNWEGGSHNGLSAGNELTKEFSSCHGNDKKILDGLLKVGVLNG